MNICPFVPRGQHIPLGLSRGIARDNESAIRISLPVWFAWRRGYVIDEDAVLTGLFMFVVRLQFERYPLIGVGMRVVYGWRLLRKSTELPA